MRAPYPQSWRFYRRLSGPVAGRSRHKSAKGMRVAAFRGVMVGCILCIFAIILFFTVLGGAAVFGVRAGTAYADGVADQVADRVGKDDPAGSDLIRANSRELIRETMREQARGSSADREQRQRDAAYRAWAREGSAEYRNRDRDD